VLLAGTNFLAGVSSIGEELCPLSLKQVSNRKLRIPNKFNKKDIKKLEK
jgi:hypothetical protein